MKSIVLNKINDKDLLNMENDGKIYIDKINTDSVLNKISDYIIKKYDDKILNKLIIKYKISDKYEFKNFYSIKIKEYINRNHFIMKILKECLDEYESINLDGFINFRLKEYYRIIEIAFNEIYKDFILKKEYDNFISLIKRYISKEKSEFYNINILVNKNNGYEIYDDLNNNITSFCINKFLEEYDYKYTNKDDFLFGTIINFATEKITIHNYKNFPNKELLNTIEKVYGNNLIKCDNCILCKNI